MESRHLYRRREFIHWRISRWHPADFDAQAWPLLQTPIWPIPRRRRRIVDFCRTSPYSLVYEPDAEAVPKPHDIPVITRIGLCAATHGPPAPALSSPPPSALPAATHMDRVYRALS